jgi:hypothetical protein
MEESVEIKKTRTKRRSKWTRRNGHVEDDERLDDTKEDGTDDRHDDDEGKRRLKWQRCCSSRWAR